MHAPPGGAPNRMEWSNMESHGHEWIWMDIDGQRSGFGSEAESWEFRTMMTMPNHEYLEKPRPHGYFILEPRDFVLDT